MRSSAWPSGEGASGARFRPFSERRSRAQGCDGRSRGFWLAAATPARCEICSRRLVEVSKTAGAPLRATRLPPPAAVALPSAAVCWGPWQAPNSTTAFTAASCTQSAQEDRREAAAPRYRGATPLQPSGVRGGARRPPIGTCLLCQARAACKQLLCAVHRQFGGTGLSRAAGTATRGGPRSTQPEQQRRRRRRTSVAR